MKTKFLLCALAGIFFSVSSIFSQGFAPPAEGNAVIYLVRYSKKLKKAYFEFFLNDRYIAGFDGRGYIRIECPAGKQLIWASDENKDFLPSEVEAGKTYVAVITAERGAWRGQVFLHPVTSDTIEFVPVKQLIMENPPVKISETQIESMNTKLADFIVQRLKQYEEVWKNTITYNHITPDMAIREEAMK